MMMMGIFSSLVTALMLLNTGANHLLDYADTETYWKSKEVKVSMEAMAAELVIPEAEDIEKLIFQLGSPDPSLRQAARQAIMRCGPAVIGQLEKATQSPDPEIAATSQTLVADLRLAGKAAAVRRLMAIRTLGELKKPAAIEHLKPLLGSKEMFVADYAAEAIARIENRRYAGPSLTPEQRAADVRLLPGKVRIVGQAQPRSTNATMPALLAKAPNLEIGPFGQMGMDRAKMIEGMSTRVITLAEKIGDVRIDGVTFGVTGDVDDDKQWGIVIITGLYDAHAAGEALRSADQHPKRKAGLDVFEVDDSRIIPVSDRRLVILGAADMETVDVAAIAANLAAGKGGLGEDEEMAPVLQAASTRDPFWLAVKTTESMRRDGELEAFDTITIGTSWRDDILQVFITGKGTDAEKVKAAGIQIEEGVKEVLEETKEFMEASPSLRTFVDAMASIKVAVTDATAVVTASVKRDDSLLGMLPMMFGVYEIEHEIIDVPMGEEFLDPDDMVMPEIEIPLEPLEQ